MQNLSCRNMQNVNFPKIVGRILAFYKPPPKSTQLLPQLDKRPERQ